MNRRQYLSAAGTASIALLAGCSSNGDEETTETPPEDDTEDGGDPTEDQPTETEPREDNSNDEEEIGSLRRELETRDIDIADLFLDTPYITLDYFTAAEDENDEALDAEIEAIALAFAEVVEEFTDNIEVLEALALTDEDTFVDVFEVRAEWARDYAAGDLSEDDYVQNVVDTLEFR